MQRNFYQTPFEEGESLVIPQTVEPESVPVHLSDQESQTKSQKVAFFNPETKKFFGRFCVDDVILIAVIILLLSEAETDVVLLMILAFLLLNGWEH